MVDKPLLRPYFSWGVPDPWGPRLTGHDQLQVGPTGSMEVWPNLGFFVFTLFPLRTWALKKKTRQPSWRSR